MFDRTQAAPGRESATTGLILSALTLLLLARGSERLGRWLVEIGECNTSRAGRRRRPED